MSPQLLIVYSLGLVNDDAEEKEKEKEEEMVELEEEQELVVQLVHLIRIGTPARATTRTTKRFVPDQRFGVLRSTYVYNLWNIREAFPFLICVYANVSSCQICLYCF